MAAGTTSRRGRTRRAPGAQGPRDRRTPPPRPRSNPCCSRSGGSPRRAEALLAEADGKLAGVATLVQHGNELEVLTLHAVQPWHGAGTALLDEAIVVARSRGCRRLWTARRPSPG